MWMYIQLQRFRIDLENQIFLVKQLFVTFDRVIFDNFGINEVVFRTLKLCISGCYGIVL